MRRRSIFILTFFIILFAVWLFEVESFGQVTKPAQTSGNMTHTLVILLSALLIAITETVRKLGWVKSQLEKDTERFLIEWNKKEVAETTNTIKAVVTDSALQLRLKEVETILIEDHKYIVELFELHRTPRNKAAAWYCRCALGEQVPKWEEISGSFDKLLDTLNDSALNEMKQISLLDNILDRQKQAFDVLSRFREELLQKRKE